MDIEGTETETDAVVEHFYRNGAIWLRTASGAEYPLEPGDCEPHATCRAQENFFHLLR